MSTIAEEILSSAKDDLVDRVATDVRVGLGYTGVMLDNGFMGLADTFRSRPDHCCDVVGIAGNLEGNAWRLAKLLGNPDTIYSSIGLATVNAVLNRHAENTEMDLIPFLDLKERERMGIVGFFEPIVGRLSDKVNMMVFDDHEEGEGIFPLWTMDYKLPKADVVIITATAIINNTIDHLLGLCRNARMVTVFGPSTPLTPMLSKHGVHFLGGMVVQDPERCMKILSQGGGGQCLHSVCSRANLDLR
jgi:uncharacterized protein